jgi:hypothetical protein
MSSHNSNSSLSIIQLIAVPAIITLAVTILRLVGELQHWSPLLFNSAAGGLGSLVGITWLALIFGIYFAVKLAHAGAGPGSTGRAIAFPLLALVVMIVGGVCSGLGQSKSSLPLVLLSFVIMAVAALIPSGGWSALFKVLLAYAFAARIPVLIVMFFAMRGNWGTHYDATPPGFHDVGFWTKFLELAFLPQMIAWIAFTTVFGSILGWIAGVFVRKSSQVAQTA